jgi:hypothetical protein
MGHDKKCPSKMQDAYNCMTKCSVTGDKSDVEKELKKRAKDSGCSDPYAMSTVAIVFIVLGCLLAVGAIVAVVIMKKKALGCFKDKGSPSLTSPLNY